MYNRAMNSKLISKLLNYTKGLGVNDLAITKHAGHHLLWADNGLDKTQLKLPFKLEEDLALAFKKILNIAPDDLVSGTYFKIGNDSFLISIIPQEDGDKIIIKRASKTLKNLKLSRLGLGRLEKKTIEQFLAHRQGLIIVASPDNEGKTTTLYALLEKIKKTDKLCYLLETHSELAIDDVNRLTSSGSQRLNDLESVRRHDSEIVVIDDANDANLIKEAANLAHQGKLVIIGIRANNINQLNEQLIGINKRKDLDSLIIFQKLIAKNCPRCLKAYINDETSELIAKYWPKDKKYQPNNFWNSQGCSQCNHSGQNGLIAAFNILHTADFQTKTLSSISNDILQKAASGLISVSKLIQKQKESLSQKL
jgi:type II secretory ATPase GspE/PulE/Tfp pilus assembly ATPase PilB-like protein